MVAAETDRASPARVLAPFVLVIGVLLALCIGGFQVLSAVRAYVGGESLWSKGRSTAVAQLRLYAATGSPSAWQRFEAALDVPLGDHEAREALDLPQPDIERARAGFLRGGNHPDDVDGMILLYRAFSSSPLMRDAVADWRAGDELIDELRRAGQALRARRAAPESTRGDELAPLDVELDALDARLVAREKHFSESLGVASRTTLRLLEAAVAGLALLMGVVVFANAIRTLRRTERHRWQLAQAHQRWSLAAATAGIGVFEWRAADDRYHFDRRAAALFGIRVAPEGGTLERQALRSLLLDEDLPALREALARARQDGAAFRVRYRVRRADGSVRHLETVGLQQPGDDGNVRGVLGVVRDVSEEELSTQLSIDKAAAERVARARIEFLSRLSHELRTPLNAVLGFSQLMLADPAEPLPPAATKRTQHIVSAGTHLLHLVDDVLDVTRIDAGQLSVQVEPVAPGEVLRAALQQVEPQRQALGIAIDAELPPELLQVRADPVRLEQVFVNLLTNGCKYNRPGGRLAVQHRVDGDHLWIDFRDQGEGLQPDEIESLFQPFRRLARHWRTEGTGLGLVIVKLLLAQMGGAIAVDSRPGQGSTFSIRLDRCADAR
ncbi:sensor histidine kinase [Ideonella sp.]|uniref:sensor histidine kinase n=1 Tax=Ideonella sp. TaxID=1929293 RepID=UPI002B49CA99|nr:ATP-binding protein [Ideonella sp.]HJV70134.1 ATP-binding protein [Ideonella sp.]